MDLAQSSSRATGHVTCHEGRLSRLFGAGDGAYQMGPQEISTMMRQRLNPVIIILNNGTYAVEEMIHKGPYNELKVPSWGINVRHNKHALLPMCMCMPRDRTPAAEKSQIVSSNSAPWLGQVQTSSLKTQPNVSTRGLFLAILHAGVGLCTTGTRPIERGWQHIHCFGEPYRRYLRFFASAD